MPGPAPVGSVRRALIWAADSGRGASHNTANTAPCRSGRPGAGAGRERESTAGERVGVVVVTGRVRFWSVGPGAGVPARPASCPALSARGGRAGGSGTGAGDCGAELRRRAGGLGEDQAGAAALGDLADSVPALGTQRVGAAPALRPQRVVVAVDT